MSREIAGTKPNKASSGNASESSYLSELFQAGIYKPNQGQVVRQVTVVVIGVAIALGAWTLYGTLDGSVSIKDSTARLLTVVGIPGVLLIGGLWASFRLVNWPKFADFLIAVEAEMKKVTWPSRDEVKRASIVVIVTIAILAISLFLFDIIWQTIFDALWATA
ncbi:MAG: preprotein translocase subunit SecE [Planctomycetota bacterium]